MTEEVKKESESEHWMNSKWRPMMGWMYMLVCTMDMVVFPILWSLLQALNHGQVTSQWQPLTLQGAGLFHIAMGAVLGIAAFGRTQEKLGGANNGGAQVPTTGFPSGITTSSTPSTGSFGSSGGFNSPAPAPSNFGSGFNGTSAQDLQPAAVTVGFGGKMAPPASPQPLI
jgi:hypothetical protein